MENKFLIELLKYEQDGNSAISSPSNWDDKPLLEIRTEMDQIIEELADDLLVSDKIARWHFFIGSPGNGKSASVGKLFRLLKDRGIVFKTRDKEVYLPNDLILPYVLCAYQIDKPYSFAYFAQDASVVQDPYAEEISPAKDMLNLIQEAWNKRKSLIICANRGIIEEALRLGENNQEYKSEKWFKNIFVKLGKPGSDEVFFDNAIKNSNCTKIKFSTSTLDFRSIVLDHLNKQNIFKELLDKAIKNENWDNCKECASQLMCPFKNNRDYLLLEENVLKLSQLIKRAEVYSGQVIVFREALALLAFILSGCSEDHIKANVKSPCEWVHRKLKNDEVFDLLGRRIYISLFLSFSPYGLEYSHVLGSKVKIGKAQKQKIKSDAHNTSSRSVFKRILQEYSDDFLSLNIGLARIFGENGVIRKLHPIYGIPLNKYENKLQEQWDLELDTLTNKTDHPLIGNIERAVFGKLKQLEDSFIASNESISMKLGWLRRWVTNITYNMGVLENCKSNFDIELDQLITAFEIPNSEETRGIKRRLRESIKNIFDEENNKKIQLTKNLAITKFEIEPLIEIPTGEDMNYGLTMYFNEKKKSPILINVQSYCWLTRKLTTNLNSKTFPSEYLDTLKVSQLRAIKDLEYNVRDKIELVITAPSGEHYSILREEGFIFRDDIKAII